MKREFRVFRFATGMTAMNSLRAVVEARPGCIANLPQWAFAGLEITAASEGSG